MRARADTKPTTHHARTPSMPANLNNQTPIGNGDLNQDLIDQMLNGKDLWSDDTLQAEIDAARVAAGVMSADATDKRNEAPSTPTAPPTVVHPVQFMPLTPEPPIADATHGIELLMDVALEVRVELGRSHMPIGDILALRTGSVVELDKLAGEPVDVLVNGTLIARGEVVVVDEKFGVRITEVVSKARRLASVA
jgi:flagellar motor switch protein FliN